MAPHHTHVHCHQPHAQDAQCKHCHPQGVADPDPLYTQTTISPFDQVTIVSQEAINANIGFPWNKSTQLYAYTGDSTDPDSSFTATMNAPTVGLIGLQGGTQLYFYLNFSKGNLMYWTGHGPSSVQHNVPVQAPPNTFPPSLWTVAFLVKMDPASIAALPPDLAAKVDVAGSYSVTQLLLDFETAQLQSFDSSGSSVTGLVSWPPR